MKNHGQVIALIAGTSVLAACGGGSGSTVSRSGPTGNTPAQQVLTENAGNAAQALADGEALRASERTSSGIMRNFDESTAAAASDTTATVMRNSAGGLTLTVPGQAPIEFTPDDISDNGFGYQKNGASLWAWNDDGMVGQIDPANGRNYLVFDYFVDLGDGNAKEAFIVTGTETNASALAALPSATYTGNSRIRVAPPTEYEGFAASVSEVQGNLSMSANFGSGTVFGSVSNLEGRGPRDVDPTGSWSPLDGALALNETAISGNGFAGSVTADTAFTTGVASVDEGSSYSGTFFGTAADGVAGAISLSGTAADGGAPYLGWGFFRGNKN